MSSRIDEGKMEAWSHYSPAREHFIELLILTANRGHENNDALYVLALESIIPKAKRKSKNRKNSTPVLQYRDVFYFKQVLSVIISP